MDTVFSKNFYMTNWDTFLNTRGSGRYLNMEEELAQYMEGISTVLPEEVKSSEHYTTCLDTIRRTKATEMVKEVECLLREDMEVVKRINAGRSCFGYTSESQEVRAKSEYRKRFEFNCLQLAVFKQKYC